ncbi:MAG: HU family DNA-binding protein [Phycisphaerales bacterium]|jgi:nucleoid DNA-binding protein|tara:strand:+ start:519 stop:971 length:453 start_codon:yes stop_codon:yes gene_type:complete
MAKKTKKKAARKPAAKKTAARKPAKKAPAKKTAAKKAPAAKKPARITAAKDKPRTKSEVLSVIADHVGISKKEAAQVFDVMGDMIQVDLKKGSCGAFNVPGMMKVSVQRKPATKARKGVNPFTKEEMVFKAKPARNVVKVRPLKALKDRV